MKRNTNKIITFLIAGLFALSFVLPALQGPAGVKLNGFLVFLTHLATINFVESFGEYVLFLFTALTNLWVVILLIWSYRKKVKLIPVICLGVLSLSSTFFWLFSMESMSVLLVGYWVWLFSVLAVVSFNLFKAFSRR